MYVNKTFLFHINLTNSL